MKEQDKEDEFYTLGFPSECPPLQRGFHMADFSRLFFGVKGSVGRCCLPDPKRPLARANDCSIAQAHMWPFLVAPPTALLMSIPDSKHILEHLVKESTCGLHIYNPSKSQVLCTVKLYQPERVFIGRRLLEYCCLALPFLNEDHWNSAENTGAWILSSASKTLPKPHIPRPHPRRGNNAVAASARKDFSVSPSTWIWRRNAMKTGWRFQIYIFLYVQPVVGNQGMSPQ